MAESWFRAMVACCMLGAALVATSQPIAASTLIEVDSNVDLIADDGFCTLREALLSANTDSEIGNVAGECEKGTGDDTIEVALVDDTIKLTLGSLDISSNITILGNDVVIDQTTLADVLVVSAGTSSVNDVTLTSSEDVVGLRVLDGGSVRLESNKVTVEGDGAFIEEGGSATLISSSFVGNGSRGVFNDGDLTVEGGTFSDNRSQGITSSFSTTTDIKNADVSENGVGGVSLRGVATVTDSTITSNPNFGVRVPSAGDATLDRVTITENERGVIVDDGSLVLHSSLISDNNLDGNVGFGGGVYVEEQFFDASATVVDSVISGNEAVTGAGVYADHATEVVIVGSQIRGNTSTAGGAAIYSDRASVTVLSSVITGNTGSTTLFTLGTNAVVEHEIEMAIYNTLIADNPLSVSGSPVRISSGGTLRVEASTITEHANDAPAISAIASGPDQSVIVVGSIVWDNADDSVAPGVVSHTIAAGPPAGVSNVAADPVFIDPANGDYRLSLGSPAIDSGLEFAVPDDDFDLDSDGDLSELAPDAALSDRVVGVSIDRGAFESGEADALTLLKEPCIVASGSLTPNSPVDLPVTGLCEVAPGASAVMVSLVAANPSAEGNFRLSAGGTPPSGGVVNYQANGLANSNTVTVPLSDLGEVRLEANVGATDYALAVIGYFHPQGTLRYVPLAPCALSDSRPNQGATGAFVGPFGPGSQPDITVRGNPPEGQGGSPGGCGIPNDADAVMINLVAINPAGSFGGIGARGDGDLPVLPTTNFNGSLPLNNAASIALPLEGDKVSIEVFGTATSSTHTRVVALGYFIGSAPAADYASVNPCAAFDSRFGTGSFAGKRTAGTSNANLTGATTYRVTGAVPAEQGGETDCRVPAGATAVLINLVALQPDAAGNLRAYAEGSTPTGGVLNFAPLAPPMNNSNAVVVPLDADGDLTVFVNSPSNDGNATVHVRGVVLGYLFDD